MRSARSAARLDQGPAPMPTSSSAQSTKATNAMLLTVPGWLLFFAVRLAITNSAATIKATATTLRRLGTKWSELIRMAGLLDRMGASIGVVLAWPASRWSGRLPAVCLFVVRLAIDLPWTLEGLWPADGRTWVGPGSSPERMRERAGGASVRLWTVDAP